MSKQYEKRDEAFSEWLEKEYPGHSIYDHTTLADYRIWMHQQQTAFNAGWAARKQAQYEAMTAPYGKADKDD